MSEFLFQSEMIRAGAGTGKTYQLIEKIYHLFHKSLEMQKRAPRLIVCTFTKKASQELKERLFKKAFESSHDFSNPHFSLKDSFLDYISSSSLQVGTIDSILYQLLKKYGQEIQLNPDFEVSSEDLNSQLFDSLSYEFFYKKHFSVLKKLTYPHLKAILLSYYRHRIQYPSLSFYDEEDFRDFTNEKDFFKDIKNISSEDLKKHSEESLNKQSYIYEMYLKSQKFYNKKKVKTKEDLKKESEILSKEFSYEDRKKIFKEEDIFKAQNFLPLFQDLQNIAEDFFISFLKKKKQSLFLSVEDLLLLSYHLLDSKPGLSKKINQDWDYWMIDEYQDTSLLQDQIIQKITGFKNVFCVGDPGQSIYSFRGADPEVFRKREKKLIDIGGSFKELKVNRRSSPALISFYNDFFPKEQFVKLENLKEKKASQDSNNQEENKKRHKSSYLSFFTYDLEEGKEIVLRALFQYIQQLSQRASYSDIAILCSKNEDIIEVSDYLKKQKTPIMISGSKTISQNRVVLDSLFLLKFLINPYDNNNLKALLRTPYFRLFDEELADSSYEYEDLHTKKYIENGKKDRGRESFWSFIKNKHQEMYFVESLSFHLENYKSKGLFEAFKQALFESGIMTLADFQDPTGSSSASLWKLMSLLKKSQKPPLDLFYNLTEKSISANHFQEPLGRVQTQLTELMTIHKSKGLQFKHVIVLDFSMGKAISSSKTGGENDSIYDPLRKKMSFSVPLGDRDRKKIKTYGHKMYKLLKRRDKIQEKDNLFYVAMTRAEESLAIFIPQGGSPEKNSWLHRISYFERVEDLLDKEKQWSLNSGVYDRDQYLLTVENCNKFKKETH